jgi:hypothetical protein
MSLEHAPGRAGPSATAPQDPSETDPDYWFSLISEGPAADFLGLKVRTLQGYRYRLAGTLTITGS